MHDPSQPPASLPEPAGPAAHTHAIAQQLRQLWGQGQAPNVFAFLAQAGAMTAAQAVAVLRVDLRERHQRGLAVRLEDYWDRLAPLRNHPEMVAVLADDLAHRQERGEAVTVEAY